MQLKILKNSTIIASPEIDEQTVYSGEHMGMDKITSVFITPAPLNLGIDDYVLYENKQYKIKHATSGVEINSKSYRYQATFYGEIYDLYDVPLSHLGRTKFSYTGTPLDLLGLIIDCLNEWFGGGWSIGDASLIAESETFPFDEVSCRVALTTIAEKFKLEYRLDNKKLYLVEKVGVVRPITLKYGRGKGLQMISREAVDQSYSTVWRFYGGNKNIPASYRNGMDRIAVDSLFEINTALYGRKGGSVTFEDVYPQRTAEVEEIPDDNSIIDTTIDFDLSEFYFTDGSAKIVFKTGELGGNEFVITGYDHTTNTIRFGTLKEEDTGYELPNESRKASIGDKYTLIGIEMPQEYLDAAEAEVLRRGIEHATKNSHPPVAFPLEIDEKYIREMELINTFQPGDSFHVESENLGVNSDLRLQSISFPLVNAAKITGVISDVLQYTTQERMVKDVKQNKRLTSIAQKSALYARQVADEVSNAAIMHQFKKTYIGERAVLSGAFVVGNPEDGEVGCVSGVGSGEDSVVFAAGSTFDERANAPFNVRRNGKGYATSFEFKDGCKVGNFEIRNGYLRTSDYGSGIPTGVLLSDEGIASRNSGATWIAGLTGIGLWGSFFGMTSEEGTLDPSLNVFDSPTWSGIVGVRLSELTNQALANTAYSRGVYGSLVSSIKNLGAEFKAIRWSSEATGTEVMGLGDHTLIVVAEKDNVILPNTPDHGMVVVIKNARSISITLTRAGSNQIVSLNNVTGNSLTLTSGQVIKLIYTSNGKRWFVMSLM